MIDLVVKGTNLPIDRNGVKIEIGSQVLFKDNAQIGAGKVLGYTENMKYVYVISSSFYKVNVYKRLGKNLIVGKDLSNWKNSKGGWY